MAYGGNKIINLILKKIYESPINGLEGVGNSNGFAFTYKVSDIPVAKLISGVATHNIEIELKVKISVNGNGVDFAKNVPMKAEGRIGVSNNILLITQLTLTNTSPNPIDNLIVSIINSQIIPPIRTTLRNIPLPRLNNLFGSGLSASIISGSVIDNGPSFEVGLRITGSSGIANANRPTDTNLESLNTGGSNKVIAMVSDEAAQLLIKESFSELSQNFNKSVNGFGFGAKIKGKIQATKLKFDIASGVGRVKTTISINNLQGGIKAPLVGWQTIGIPCPDLIVEITNSISVSGNRAIITLTGVDNINIDLNFPSLLSPVESLLEGLFNTILRAFHRKISDIIEGTKFEIFRLSGDLLGNNLNVNLGFEPGGLRYTGNSIQAIIKVS